MCSCCVTLSSGLTLPAGQTSVFGGVVMGGGEEGRGEDGGSPDLTARCLRSSSPFDKLPSIIVNDVNADAALWSFGQTDQTVRLRVKSA
ncbi:hypothetical protein BaRGS_00010574 [Batillaria attramentaria]|uniref:Uncharacterized protein n=1 Tax=Batillaria attramentaria TaxID=370345 RepID=A0ABD0LFF2_9CAEN